MEYIAVRVIEDIDLDFEVDTGQIVEAVDCWVPVPIDYYMVWDYANFFATVGMVLCFVVLDTLC